MSTLLSSLSAAQIKRAVAIKEQIEELQARLDGLLDEVPAAIPPATAGTAPKKRVMSAAARAKIGAAQKAIWAAKRRAQAPKTAAQAADKPKIVRGAGVRGWPLVSRSDRWAGPKDKPSPVSPKPKRRLSSAGRARIIAATKARWARYNAAKKA
jgi:hypothetical protein